MSRFIKRKIGIAFWVVVFVGVAMGVKPVRKLITSDSDVSLVRYLIGPTEETQFEAISVRVEANDPIFLQDQDGSWRQVGYVTGFGPITETSKPAMIAWHARDIPIDQCELFAYRSTGNIEELIATMLPPEKRLQIQQRLAAAMSSHGDELSAAFVPLVQQSLKQSMPVIEDEFRKTISRHRGEVDAIAERWNDEIVGKRLLPLARDEVMPIVRRHGQPPAEAIGREIWDRASLWRFGWRAFYDKTPLPEKKLVQEEWKRFVEQEAVPVMEAHMDEVVDAVQNTLRDVASNPKVRTEMAGVAEDLAKDPETQRLLRTILKETLVDNDRLRDVWSRVWTSDEAQEALDLAGDRLEPVIREIGDELFGSRDEGIDPNFARVLRSQILGKDRRWIVAWHTSLPATREIKPSAKSMPYPVVYMANPNEEVQP